MTGLVSFVRELGKELDLLRDAIVAAAKRTFLA